MNHEYIRWQILQLSKRFWFYRRQILPFSKCFDLFGGRFCHSPNVLVYSMADSATLQSFWFYRRQILLLFKRFGFIRWQILQLSKRFDLFGGRFCNSPNVLIYSVADSATLQTFWFIRWQILQLFKRFGFIGGRFCCSPNVLVLNFP
jgi:hypothetical protein